MLPRSEITVGKIGEYLCAAALLRMGVKADIVNQDGFDILAYVGKSIIKIQVKSTTCPRTVSSSSAVYYNFSCAKNSKKKILTKKDADIMCFVAIDRKLCYFIPVEDLTGITKKIKPDFYDQTDIEDSSWDDCFKRYSKPSPMRNRDSRGKSKRNDILSSIDAGAD